MTNNQSKEIKKPRHRFLISNTRNDSKPVEDQNRLKKLKIRLSIIKDELAKTNSTADSSESTFSKQKKRKDKLKFRRFKDGNYLCGRWQPDEHQRFIEAILKYGNEWKAVQKHVGTRSSTQARSHAQKFFVKMKKSSLFNFDIDFSKNSIRSLHSIANNLTDEEYNNAVKALNCVAFEHKNHMIRRKREEELDSLFDINSNLFRYLLYLLSEDLINLGDINSYSIINNYNVNSNNFDYLLKKRHRLNSFEELINMFPILDQEVENNDYKINTFNDDDFKVIFQDYTKATEVNFFNIEG
jgi:SHAQKYF class myb-like DNA-binding protein